MTALSVAGGKGFPRTTSSEEGMPLLMSRGAGLRSGNTEASVQVKLESL